MKSLSILLLALLLPILSGCAGTGFNKKATVMPDQIKLEADANPQDNWDIKEVTVGCSWNLK